MPFASRGSRAESLVIEGIAVDDDTDTAIFVVALQSPTAAPFFDSEFLLGAGIPPVNDLVCVLSFGSLSVSNDDANSTAMARFVLANRPVLRVGRVIAHHPLGHRLSRGPCIETSIPVYSGMSGGPVFRYTSEGPMRVFGLVCSDPDPDVGGDKENRLVEGRSIFALLPLDVTASANGMQLANIRIRIAHVAGRLSLAGGSNVSVASA